MKVDTVHETGKWIDHNRGLVAGLLVALLIAVPMVGCQLRTVGLLGEKVTGPQLQAQVTARLAELDAEVAAVIATGEAGAADLERQQTIRDAVINWGAGAIPALAAGGLPALTSLLPTLLLIGAGSATAGMGYDNRKKGKEIAKRDAVIEANRSPARIPPQAGS